MAAIDPPPVGADSEDRRKWFDYIQAVIARMSSASSVAKGWALTIATATFGYGASHLAVVVVLLGMFAVVLFASIDARYLREERKYRLLFDAARSGRAELYEMNATRYYGSMTHDETTSVTWSKVVWSWSIRDFYGLILVAGLVLTVLTVCWS